MSGSIRAALSATMSGPPFAPGHTLEIAGPYGHFGFTANDHRPAICVAGGTGLAPIKAMIEDELARKSGRRIRLLYGARSRDDLYDIGLLDAWAARSGEFSYAIALSAEPEGSDWTGPRGTVTELLADTVYDGFGAEAFLCGPPPMIDAAMPVLAGYRPRTRRHPRRPLQPGQSPGQSIAARSRPGLEPGRIEGSAPASSLR